MRARLCGHTGGDGQTSSEFHVVSADTMREERPYSVSRVDININGVNGVN